MLACLYLSAKIEEEPISADVLSSHLNRKMQQMRSETVNKNQNEDPGQEGIGDQEQKQHKLCSVFCHVDAHEVREAEHILLMGLNFQLVCHHYCVWLDRYLLEWTPQRCAQGKLISNNRHVVASGSLQQKVPFRESAVRVLQTAIATDAILLCSPSQLAAVVLRMVVAKEMPSESSSLAEYLSTISARKSSESNTSAIVDELQIERIIYSAGQQRLNVQLDQASDKLLALRERQKYLATGRSQQSRWSDDEQEEENRTTSKRATDYSSFVPRFSGLDACQNRSDQAKVVSASTLIIQRILMHTVNDNLHVQLCTVNLLPPYV